MISAASWRTWSLAVRAMALLVQPTVRVRPRAPSPPLSPPAGPPQAAPAPAPLSLPFPPRFFHSHRLCPLPPLLLPRQWLAGQLHLLSSRRYQPSRPNTFSPQLCLERLPPRSEASCPAGLAHLLLRLLLLHQVSLFSRLLNQ